MEARVLLNDFQAQWQLIRPAAIAAVDRVGKSGWLILGREVAQFEQQLAAFAGVAHVVGCASGLDAIEIALRVLGLEPGDQVITSPLSAFATTLAVIRAGEIWNWESPAGKLRWKRRVRMLTSHLAPSHTVLELGCGTAYFTRYLAQTGARITAIDISPDLLAAAREHCPAANVTFDLQNAYELNYPDGSFHSVVGSSVLHHLEIKKALREIYRVLRPGGTIRFTEPNMLNPQIALQKNVSAIKRALGDSPDETAFFRWPLQRLIEITGFQQIEISPFEFLHPKLPSRLIPLARLISAFLERTPLVSEFAGSLYIGATK